MVRARPLAGMVQGVWFLRAQRKNQVIVSRFLR